MEPGRFWLPVATSVVFLGLMAALHATSGAYSGAYASIPVRLLAGTTLVAAAALSIVSLVPTPSRVRARLEFGWLGLVVLAALWIAAVEARSLASGTARVAVSAVGPWIVVSCLAIRAPLSHTIVAALAAATLCSAAAVMALGQGSVSWLTIAGTTAFNYGLVLLTCLIRRATPLTFLASPSNTKRDLGSYTLLAPIGAGGMGEVWRATHQMLARQAAIKMVRPRNTQMTAAQRDQWVRRFHREANTIAGLQSPNTIYLYDFGVARDGQFYYVMELLDGISLDVLVKTFGPQPPARVRHILRQACESLEEAHQRNLVHRDLKPSNIMLCKLALSHDFVKVLDFGLAKCAACEDVAQITLENVAAGTPGYIAPEVALGETSVDGRADLYALGCVAYFLLTGEMVFVEANPMSMVVKHVQTPPVPPSQRTRLPIPADLEAIVMHCLEKSPSSRPPSARHVATMLDACRIDVWTEAEAAAWWARHLPESSALRSTNASSTAVAS